MQNEDRKKAMRVKNAVVNSNMKANKTAPLQQPPSKSVTPNAPETATTPTRSKLLGGAASMERASPVVSISNQVCGNHLVTVTAQLVLFDTDTQLRSRLQKRQSLHYPLLPLLALLKQLRRSKLLQLFRTNDHPGSIMRFPFPPHQGDPHATHTAAPY
jgi:hypothetical protein